MLVARLLLLAAGASLAYGCASATGGRAASTDVHPGVAALAGEWRGEYADPETGRKGVIYLALRADERVATGDVVMLRNSGTPVVHWQDRVTMASARVLGEPLTVRFVSTESGLVSGKVAPYLDPDCGHVHSTTFFGEIRDGRISGGFISRSSAHDPQTGEWAASRVR